MDKIGVIIILFNPTIEQVINKFTKEDNVFTYFIDNTQKPNSEIQKVIESEFNSIYFSFNKNVGIAKAQNKGIELAIKDGISYFVFFDQDSTIKEDYPKKIKYIYQNLRNQGVKVGILGPSIINENILNRKIKEENFEFIKKKKLYHQDVSFL